jgi:hypothetical protein
MAKGNPHPVPLKPRYTTAEHPEPGQGVSYIEAYNLTAVVREMRLKGHSYRAIADYINGNKLIPNGYVLSYNSIVRWCNNHGLGGTIEASAEYEAVNTYNVNCKLLETMQSTLDTLQLRLDEINKNPMNYKMSEIGQLVSSLDKIGLRIQVLSASIGEMQEKVYKYEAVAKAMEAIMAVISVRVSPEDYEAIKNVLREDPILRETLKVIAPTNA